MKGIEEVPLCDSEDKLVKDWEKYWSENSPALIWNSWVEKYKEFINPEYLDTEGQQNNEPSSVDTVPPDSDWSKIWEDHQQEQYWYYHNWFSQWWMNEVSIATDPTSESEIESYSCITENRGSVSPTSIGLEELSINPEMDDSSTLPLPKEQKDKTVLEKTRDYLNELGFSTTINQSSSCVIDCNIEMKKKKRKKPKKHKIVAGPVLSDPTSLVSKF